MLISTEQRRPYKRVVDDGSPLSELLGRAFADAEGREYEPPAVAELANLLGAENYRLLKQNPKIAEGIKFWAAAKGEDRASLVKPLAVLIAHEACKPGLEWRIRQEISRLG